MIKKKLNNDFVTKTMLDEAVDAILEGMNTMFQEFKTQNSIEHMEIKQEIADLKTNTPTTTQFNKTKNDFDSHMKYHHLASAK